MSDVKPQRSYSRAFKIALLVRLDRGERLAEVAKEAGIRRKLLYEWRDAFRKDGEAGLNRKRGPKPGPRTLKPPPEPALPGSPQELVQAKARIAELEGKIGRQQIELDFFAQALRALGEPVDAITAKPSSTRSSKP